LSPGVSARMSASICFLPNSVPPTATHSATLPCFAESSRGWQGTKRTANQRVFKFQSTDDVADRIRTL
jgi:hypothetical protein